jgi:hypothetical protein
VTYQWEAKHGVRQSSGGGDSADCAPERTQLDLFLDTQDTVLVNRIVASLLEGKPDSAEEAVARLRAENPEHPDLPMFVRLWKALRSGPPDPGSLAGLRALIESLKGLIPAADRLLAGGARAFLLRWWQTLAQAGVELPSAEAEPPVRYWLALARHHLGDEREALRLWLALCWLDPDSFTRFAPRLPSAILREAWTAFQARADHDETETPGALTVPWFPAWFAVRQRWVARLFHADEIPDTDAPLRALRLLRTLLPLESQGYSAELVRQRRMLRQISPAFFRVYWQVVVEARPVP